MDAFKADDQYVYHPLKSSEEIRTVEIISTSGNDLECRITHVKIAKETPQVERYEALSYVWGSQDKPFRILVRDTAGNSKGYIPLTLSLYNALQDLRDSPEIISKVFWIDQICINQEHDEEKGSQVAQMGRIFKNAIRVITYLGPKCPTDEATIELITLLNYHFKPNYPMLVAHGWR